MQMLLFFITFAAETIIQSQEMQSFLQRIARKFVAEHKEVLTGQYDSLARYTFVFPNHRAGLFFRKALSEQLTVPAFAPETISINDCFAQFTPLRVADTLTLLLKLYEDYSAVEEELHQEAEAFEDFLPTGKMILTDFSEVDNHLVGDVKGLFTVVSDLKEVEEKFDYLTAEQRRLLSRFWGEYNMSAAKREQGTKSEAEGIHTSFVRIWKLLAPLYQRFTERLLSEGVAYEGLLHRDAVRRLSEGGVQDFDTTYVFVGFNALGTAESELMKALKAAGRAQFFFDYEAPLLRRKDNRASLFAEQNIADFGEPELDGQEEFVMPEMTCIHIPSAVAETFEVHRILSDIAESEPEHDWTRTAVVLPDERMLLPMLHAIPQKIGKINVTTGYPLAATGLWSLTEHLIRLQRSKRRGSFYHRDVLALLRHPLIASDESERLQRYIISKKCYFIAQTTIAADKYDERLVNLFRPAVTAAEMTEWLTSVFAAIEVESSHTEALYLLLTALNRLHNLFADNTALGGSDNLSLVSDLLKLLLSDASVPYVGEPLQGLQILGVLETRVLDFEDIILTCFNDDMYPGHSRANTFIPYSLRKAFGLPVPERQDAIFAYNFYHMLSYAKRVWFISNSIADDRHTGEPSRFLYQLRYQFGCEVKEENVLFLPKTARAAVQSNGKTDEEMLGVKALLEKGISASAINDYFRCKRLFRFRHVFGLREPDTLDDDVAANDFGTYFHEIMENLYKEVTEPKKKRGEDPKIEKGDIRQLLSDLDTKIRCVKKLQPVKDNKLLMDVLKRYTESTLLTDIKYAPFTIEGMEDKKIKTLTADDDVRFTIVGKIDRMDRLESNSSVTRIIDYKTGKCDTVFASVESLFDTEYSYRNKNAFQTLFYCLLAEDDAATAVFEPHLFGIRSLSEQKAGQEETETLVHIKGKDGFCWAEIREDFVDRLKAFIKEELLNVDKPFSQVPEEKRIMTCKNCEFSSICEMD